MILIAAAMMLSQTPAKTPEKPKTEIIATTANEPTPDSFEIDGLKVVAQNYINASSKMADAVKHFEHEYPGYTLDVQKMMMTGNVVIIKKPELKQPAATTPDKK